MLDRAIIIRKSKQGKEKLREKSCRWKPRADIRHKVKAMTEFMKTTWKPCMHKVNTYDMIKRTIWPKTAITCEYRLYGEAGRCLQTADCCVLSHAAVPLLYIIQYKPLTNSTNQHVTYWTEGTNTKQKTATAGRSSFWTLPFIRVAVSCSPSERPLSAAPRTLMTRGARRDRGAPTHRGACAQRRIRMISTGWDERNHGHYIINITLEFWFIYQIQIIVITLTLRYFLLMLLHILICDYGYTIFIYFIFYCSCNVAVAYQV